MVYLRFWALIASSSPTTFGLPLGVRVTFDKEIAKTKVNSGRPVGESPVMDEVSR